MKIYINTDLEGICSFVDWEEVNYKTGRGIQFTKQLLTYEVNAAIEGIFSAVNDAEIVVQDGHGGGYWGSNIIAEELDNRAGLILGKRGVELAVIDNTFDLYFGIGVHSMAGTWHGNMSHTIGTDIMNYWINGIRMGEAGICASIAGYYRVPVAMVAGDFWAVRETEELLGDIVGVSVKKGINMYTAICPSPHEARRLIKEGAKAAVLGRDRFKPYKVDSPVEIKIEYTGTVPADRAELRNGAIRLDGRTVSFSGNDFIQVFLQSFA